jgi:hypothetical protein
MKFFLGVAFPLFTQNLEFILTKKNGAHSVATSLSRTVGTPRILFVPRTPRGRGVETEREREKLIGMFRMK